MFFESLLQADNFSLSSWRRQHSTPPRQPAIVKTSDNFPKQSSAKHPRIQNKCERCMVSQNRGQLRDGLHQKNNTTQHHLDSKTLRTTSSYSVRREKEAQPRVLGRSRERGRVRKVRPEVQQVARTTEPCCKIPVLPIC